MIVQQARLRLADSVSFLDKAVRIKEHLVKHDLEAISLTLYEVNYLWEMYSEDSGGRFFVVSDEELEGFVKWLEEAN